MSEVPVNVCVAVRVRPLLPSERLHSHQVCVKKVPKSKNQLLVGKDRSFTFDHLHWWNAKQQDIYKTTVKPLVESCFQGYNATVFAYGQTGSGKTYTIGGSNPANITKDEQGIIPRAVEDLFSQMKSQGRKHIDHTVKVSYVEIYKEEVRDLLEVDLQKCQDVHIREDQNGNTVIVGAREENCTTAEEVLSLLQKGSAVRHTGATQMNELSSRSHAIFTIHVIQTWPSTPRPKNPNVNNSNSASQSFNGMTESDEFGVEKLQNVMSSKFHFVDLAGSERANRTGNTGERFKESVQINTGLLALGNVISALGDPKKKKGTGHISYRDSKITRVLKDSLGGNARTVMITCISPSSTSFDETLNALKYANRAKNIQNKPVVNRDPQQILIEEMQDEIEELKQQLQSRPTTREVAMQKQKVLESEVEELQNQCRLYKKHIEDAVKQFKAVNSSKPISKVQSNSIKKWIDSVTKSGLASSKMSMNGSFSAAMSREEKIQQELEECKRNLESDDKVFAAKDTQIEQLGKALSEVQEEIREKDESLQLAEEVREQQGEKLIEQKVIIEQLQEEILYMKEEFQRVLPTSSRRQPPTMFGRAQSVPHPTRGVAFSTESRFLSEEAKRAHSSPPLISAERIMAGFRARNHVIADRIEEEDEVDHRSFLADDYGQGSDPSRDNGGVSDRSTSSKKRENFIQQQQWRISSARKTSGTNHEQETQGNAESELNTLRESTVLSIRRLKDSELRAQNSNNKIRELSINIRMKEELIKDLVRTGNDAEAVNRDYLGRIQMLEREVQAAKRDLLDSHKVLQAQQNSGGNEQELQKLKSDYELKLKDAKVKVQLLQKKQRETEKIATIPTQNKKKIKELEIGIAAMRQMQEDMQKKLKTEQDKKRKLESELSRDQAKIKELEVKNKKQEKILKRKTEEVVAIQKRLRNTKGTTRDDTNEVDKQRRWLDEEVEKALEQQKLLKQLEDALRAREAAVIRREEALKRKAALETKKMRSSQAISSETLQLASKMAAVDQRLSARTQQLRDSLTLGSDQGVHGSASNRQQQLRTAIERLQAEKNQLEEKKRKLEGKLQDGEILDSQDERELIELDEAVEALTAAIEWQDDTIMRASTSADLRESRLRLARERNSGLQKHMKSLSATEAGMLLTKCFERVIELREQEQFLENKIAEMEARLHDRDRSVQESETALNRFAVESDRKLMEMEKLHEQRTQQLIKQISDQEVTELQSRIETLEKDLSHYKLTNKDLKKKMRDMAGAEDHPLSARSDRTNSESDLKSGKKDRDGISPERMVVSSSNASKTKQAGKFTEADAEKQRYASPKRQKRPVARQSSGDMAWHDQDLTTLPASPCKMGSNPNLVASLRRSRPDPFPHTSSNSVEYSEYQDLNQNLPSASRANSGARRLSPNNDPLLTSSHPPSNPPSSHNRIMASLQVTDPLSPPGSKVNPNLHPLQPLNSEKSSEALSKSVKIDPSLTPIRLSKKDLKRISKNEVTQRKTSMTNMSELQAPSQAAGALQDSLDASKNPW